MRERDWLTTTDPEPMLRFLRGRASLRKARLLTCSTARLLWDQLTDERSRRAVEVSELYADGLADAEALAAAADGAVAAVVDAIQADVLLSPTFVAYYCTADTVDHMWGLARVRWPPGNVLLDVTLRLLGWWLGREKVSTRRPTPEVWCHHIRDVFGNTYRPVDIDPSWRTTAVLALAEGVYQERAFDRLPVLADALEDAGSTDEEVLTHCRSPGPHVPGCWLVDLLTGRG